MSKKFIPKINRYFKNGKLYGDSAYIESNADDYALLSGFF